MPYDEEPGEQIFQALIEAAPDAVVLADRDDAIRYANTALLQKFGYAREELLGQRLSILHPELQQFRERGAPPFETVARRRDGTEFPAEVRLGSVTVRREAYTAGFIRDITPFKQYQQRILRLSRIQAVLSGINALTVRERSRPKLLEGACRIAVEQGQLRMAWVGMVHPDGGIRPVASFGMDRGYFEAIAEQYLSANRQYVGPSARCVAEKRPVVVNDMAQDAALEAARAHAASRGLHGVAAVPLLAHGAVIAVICLYSGEAGFFDEEEVNLLQQLAADLSYALEFIEREEQLHYASSFDALTGLANRKLFLDRVDQFVDSSRQRQRKLAVLVLDLVRFKSINDTLGHAGADEVLKQASERLLRFAGSAAYVGRVGGDRFAAIVPDLEEAGALTRVLQDKVWQRLGRPFAVEGHEVRPSARVGVAVFPDDGSDAAALFRNAEAAVKRAKEVGERFLFYKPEMTTSVTKRLTLEAQMRQALERQEFVMHYQPKVDLRTGVISGGEALLRWQSPKHGLVMPYAFMQALEESGLIIDVGRWALQQAARDRRAWIDAQVRAVPVAVNASPQQLREPDFVEVVTQAMQAADRRGTGLEIEVTESILMASVDLAAERLKGLRQHGVPTAIDDFGTGYSSLAYLAKLPVSALKIDRSFIVSLTENADTMAIVSAIIALAHSMNLKVVAEGVDSAEQLKFLRLLRCDELQGFVFSPAVPADAFAELLRSGKTLA